MSMRLDMLQAASKAPQLLGDSTARVEQFLRSQLNPDGGFKDRAGDSDVYYSVFGLAGLMAIGAEVPWDLVADYLASITNVESLDLVHTGCLARCWAALPEGYGGGPRDAIRRRVMAFRSGDGAFAAKPGKASGTLYGCYVAVGIHEDLGIPIPAAVADSVAKLRQADGGYANGDGPVIGLIPATAAAVVILPKLVGADTAQWMLTQQHAKGGFLAIPDAPIPDLLSTATALHALATLHADLQPLKETTLDFIDTLWSPDGGFHGHWEDDALDCEYTFYGLLALGHLSEC